MRYLIVVPARGGSKGIPLKNIHPLCGKPLLMYTLELIKKLEFEGDAVVSTDMDLIADMAKMVEGIGVIDRPKDIATDTASTESALLHALEVMESIGNHYDAVVTMQVTSPFRTVETTIACFRKFEEERDHYDALLTLSETRTDFWIKKEDGSFGRLYPHAPRRRQDRKPMYIENSALYITDAEALRKTHSVLGNNVMGVVIPENEALDINEPIDIAVAEQIMREETKA